MSELSIDRRRFIVAAITLSGIASGLRYGRAWAQDASSVDADTERAMADMARRLYPHDSLPDAVYAQVLNDAMAVTAADGAFAGVLREAEDALNALQTEDFVDLDEQAQIDAIRAVEQTAFFGAIQTAVRVGIYNHPAVWELLGYDGPSFQQGGYLNRGAGDIDWLPESE